MLILKAKKLLCYMERISATVLVKQYMVSKGHKLAYLSRKMYGEAGETVSAQNNLSRKLRKDDISVELLKEISIALGHNFFYELAQDKSLPQPPVTELTLDQLIDKKLNDKLKGK